MCNIGLNHRKAVFNPYILAAGHRDLRGLDGSAFDSCRQFARTHLLLSNCMFAETETAMFLSKLVIGALEFDATLLKLTATWNPFERCNLVTFNNDTGFNDGISYQRNSIVSGIPLVPCLLPGFRFKEPQSLVPHWLAANDSITTGVWLFYPYP